MGGACFLSLLAVLGSVGQLPGVRASIDTSDGYERLHQNSTAQEDLRVLQRLKNLAPVRPRHLTSIAGHMHGISVSLRADPRFMGEEGLWRSCGST